MLLWGGVESGEDLGQIRVDLWRKRKGEICCCEPLELDLGTFAGLVGEAAMLAQDAMPELLADSDGQVKQEVLEIASSDVGFGHTGDPGGQPVWLDQFGSAASGVASAGGLATTLAASISSRVSS